MPGCRLLKQPDHQLKLKVPVLSLTLYLTVSDFSREGRVTKRREVEKGAAAGGRQPAEELEEIKSSINTLRETCTNGFSDTIEATNGTTSAIVDHLTQATEEHNKTAAQINAE
ncbi:hypothetical protein CYMTET_3227 [Cymbomonas tetramitiformis]|uniref:Uncharacterized protein n=1 Tax=Cymbomonas tetramitiformis TaxID=36881 RepID=A0AAE0H3K6_9CHLO|nr:hypothetical protein CYMTET_3227 [Cymbomonas tetramitiformis]